MYISTETVEQTEERLRKVISTAEFKVFDGAYNFEEYPINDFEFIMENAALAFVRDEEVWSQLVPSEDMTKELFKVIGFNFRQILITVDS